MIRLFHEKALSVFLTVIITLLFAAVMLAGNLAAVNNLLPPALIIVLQLLCFCGAVYLILRKSVRKFIVERMTPIYQLVSNRNRLSEIREQLKSEGLEQIETDMAEWASIRSEEFEQMKQTARFRREFVGDVSHEIKTPIFNIQGYVLTLLDGAMNDPVIARKYLENAEKNIDRLISIVEDLNAISKLERGEIELEKSTFDVVKLAYDVLENLSFKARNHEVNLYVEFDRNEPIKVLADRKRIFQVLVNLIENGINYGKPGGQVSVNFSVMPRQLLVEVNDNGIGIADADIPRVFERFYRADKHRSRQAGGSGLGLAIVKHIVEAHKQTINVRSEPGKGSSFVFTLDRAL